MKKRLKKILSLATVLAMGVALLAGCGSESSTDSTADNNSGTSTAEVEAEETSSSSGRDTLIFSIPSDITSVDAGSTASYGLFVNRQIYETLIYLDENGDAQPKLATSWEYSDDGTVLTLEIREGVTFHNGETMTVDDVVYSLNRTLASAYAGARATIVESVSAVDDTHVAIQMSYAYAPMINYLGQVHYSIVCKSVVEAAENEIMDASNACGTGPYVLEAWDSGEKIVLTSYDNYWQGEEASIKEITYIIQADSSTAALSLENGEVDIIFNAAETDLARFEEDDDITGVVEMSENIYSIWLSTTGDYTSDVLVRQAIALAIDKEELLVGSTTLDIPLSSSMIRTTSKYYTDLSEYEPERDVEKAKELLAEAGYPDGFTFTLNVSGSVPMYQDMAVVLQAQLAEIGITVEIEVMEATAYTQQVTMNRDFDVNLGNINGLMDDPDSRFSQFTSDSTTNYLNVNNKEYDKLVMQAQTTTDVEERTALYAEAQEIVLYEEYNFVPLFYGWITYAYNSDLQGLYIDGGFNVNLYDCYWN